jgi:predicted nucleic-acid-binding Zn-ribbon protein
VKQAKKCPRCASLRIAHLATQVDEGDSYYERKLGLKREKRFFDSQAIGLLEAYVCASCGYFETYVQEPEQVDWDNVQGLTWVNPLPPDGEGPYR